MMYQNQKGFTLLEALITVVVISIGLLGLLGLQSVGLSSTQTAQARSIAVLEINNIMNRMRANPGAVANDEFADVTNPTKTKPGTDCQSASCDEAEMAAFDVYQWGEKLAAQLPSGTGTIICNDSPCNDDSVHTITVSWNEKNRGEGAGNGGTATQQLQAVYRP